MQGMQVTTASSAVNGLMAALPTNGSVRRVFLGGFRVRISALTMNMVSAVRTIAKSGITDWQVLSDWYLAPDSYNKLYQ